MFYFDLGCGRAVKPSPPETVVTVARRATEKAMEDLKSFEPSIVFVYMTSDFAPYEEPLQAISDTLRGRGWDFNKVPLIGGTISALVDNKVYSSGLAIWILGSEHISANATSIESVFDTDREERINAALDSLKLPEAHASHKGFLFTVMPGYKSLEAKEETWLDDAAILDCIVQRIGYRVPVFGGSTSDDLQARDGKKARQFFNGRVLRNSAVLAWVETGLKFGIGMPHNYNIDTKEILPEMITKLQGDKEKGSVVEEIGGMRVRKYFDELDKKFGGDKHYLVGARGADGSFSIAFPFKTQTERGTVTFHPQLDLSTMLIPIRVTKEDFIKSASSAVEQAIEYVKPDVTEFAPVVIFLSSCRGKINRISAMSDSKDSRDAMNAEVRPIKDKYTGTQILGCYGTGEQGLIPSAGIPTSQAWLASALIFFDELNERAEMTRVRAVDRFLERVSEEAASVEALQSSIIVAVNKLVMGDGCSLFLRSDYVPWDPHEDRNRFVLVVTSGLINEEGISYLPKSAEIISKHYYEVGQGLTGWVAKYGVPLRIHSRREDYLEKKRQELIDRNIVERVGGELDISPLCWTDKVRENRPIDEFNSPYLAVPIKIGKEIIGIVRTSEISKEAKARGKQRFSSFDERVLEICSHYILTSIAVGYKLIIHQEAMMEDIVRRLGHALKSAVGLAEANLTALSNKVGKSYEPYFCRAREAIGFLKRAGELSRQYWQAEILDVREQVEVVSVLEKLIRLIMNNRVVWVRPQRKYYVRGNRSALENVFFEIINNSLDFIDSETGKVRVEVRQENEECVVDIIDNGPGIHPSIRDNLFEYLAAFPEHRLGMALAVAKQIIKKHEGTITELNPEHGAHFRVVLHLFQLQQNRRKQNDE